VKQKIAYLIFSIVITYAFSGCSNADEKFISEGAIVYSAKVVDETNPMANLAPSKMTIYFKDNKSCAEMSAGMGLFSTSFISDPETKTLTQLVKLLNKKFSLVQNEQEIKKENANYPMKITPLPETKIVAGYNCKKAHVKLGDEYGTEFDIFYTNDLDIKNPNFANPYCEIDGILMEYQMKKFGLEMRFTATSVKKEVVDDAIFELPADFKKISQEEMNELFLGLQ
jgi:hypothetical protein